MPYIFKHSLRLIYLIVVQGAVLVGAEAQEVAPDKSQQYEESLGNIGKKINAISRNLNASKALVSSERDKLLKAEKNLVNLSKTLQLIEGSLDKGQAEYNRLVKQIKEVNESQENNRSALKTLIKSRYYQGKPEFLKSLLNQQNPYAVGRLLNYNRYFSNALMDQFSELSAQATVLEQLKLQESTVIAKLKQEKTEQSTLKSRVIESTASRTDAIKQLDQKIATSEEALEALKKDRSRLESLLTQLKIQAAELDRLEKLRAQREAEKLERESRERKKNEAGDAKQPKPIRRLPVKGGFLKQKGRLSYPVVGNLVRSFGSRLQESGMRSEGLFFSTQGSVAVRSIFRGRVIFSDFLKGYGLLIIVDHGDDHISLYGHNERLFKKVGDKVRSDEIIANSGVTGGLKSHGLYFEIRDNATPVDASKWCR